MSIDIRNVKNKADYEKKLKTKMDYLRLQAKLNADYTKAMAEYNRENELGVQPIKQPQRTTAELLQDKARQSQELIANLNSVLDAEQASSVLSKLSDEDKVLMNKTWGDFVKQISGYKYIDADFFVQLWKRYGEKLIRTKFLDIPLQSGEEMTNPPLRAKQTKEGELEIKPISKLERSRDEARKIIEARVGSRGEEIEKPLLKRQQGEFLSSLKAPVINEKLNSGEYYIDAEENIVYDRETDLPVKIPLGYRIDRTTDRIMPISDKEQKILDIARDVSDQLHEVEYDLEQRVYDLTHDEALRITPKVQKLEQIAEELRNLYGVFTNKDENGYAIDEDGNTIVDEKTGRPLPWGKVKMDDKMTYGEYLRKLKQERKKLVEFIEGISEGVREKYEKGRKKEKLATEMKIASERFKPLKEEATKMEQEIHQLGLEIIGLEGDIDKIGRDEKTGKKKPGRLPKAERELKNELKAKLQDTKNDLTLKEYEREKFRKLHGVGIKRKKGYGISENDSSKYIPFGKYVIDFPALKENKLKIKYDYGASLPSIPIQMITKDLSMFLLDVIKEGKVNETLFKKLNKEEKKLFQHICKKCKIDETLNISDEEIQNDRDDEEMLKRFELVRGEFIAGNNSPHLIKELKQLLIKFIHEGKISKQHGYDLLLEISCVS